MAAFLKLDVLRAHAVPGLPQGVLDDATAHPFPTALSFPTTLASPTSPPFAASSPRPVLTACWLAAPDGRLTCRWQTDVSAPFGPPPH
jgi:hypothetical protein